jgi:hypothetical protein
MEKRGLSAYDLKALWSDGPTRWLNPVVTEEFALGPLTEAKLWEGERAAMNLDRRPCKLYMPL